MAVHTPNQGFMDANGNFGGLDTFLENNPDLPGARSPYEKAQEHYPAGSYTSSFTAEPVGNTYRGFGSDWFNKENIAKEDFARAEQAADNQLKRDLYLYEKNKEFAREQMSWQERMANSAYQRAVEDMKKAGINPVMAINQGGAATPSGSSASPGRSSSGYRNAGGFEGTTAFVASIISLIAGVYGAASKNATQLAIAQLSQKGADSRQATQLAENLYRDDQWRNYYDKRRR